MLNYTAGKLQGVFAKPLKNNSSLNLKTQGVDELLARFWCWLNGGAWVDQNDLINGGSAGADGEVAKTGCVYNGNDLYDNTNATVDLNGYFWNKDSNGNYSIGPESLYPTGSNPAGGGANWVSVWIIDPANGCVINQNDGGGNSLSGDGLDDGSGPIDCTVPGGHWEYYPLVLPTTLSDQEPQDNDYYTDLETNITYRFGDIEDFFENNPDIVYNLNEENFDQINYPGNPIFLTLTLGHAIGIEAATLRVINPTWGEAHIWAVATWDVIHNGVHLGLDVVGLVPAFGTVTSLVNGGIYYIEGDKINCAISVAAAIPFESWIVIGGKWVRAGTALTVPITEKAVKYGIKVVIVGKDVRFIKVAVEAFDYAALKATAYIKPASATLTNLSRTLIDKYGIRVLPSETTLKNMVEDIRLGDPTGEKTEQLAHKLLEKDGYVKYDAKFGSNNGFDGVYIKGDPANPTDIIINEAKQMNTAGSIKLNAANNATGLKSQMSDDWIEQTITSMENNTSVSTLGNTLRQNYSKITKTVTAVDKSSGEIVVLKLDKY